MTLKKDLRRLWPGLKVGFSLLLIIFLLKRFDIAVICQNIKNTRVEFLLLALFLNFIGDLLSSLQWKLVLSIYNIRLGLGRLFKYYLIGAFFNNFLPTSIGGDVYKVHQLIGHRIGFNYAFTSVLMTRVMGLVSLLLIATITLLSPLNLSITGTDLQLLFLVLWIIVIFSFFMPKFLSKIKFLSHFHNTINNFFSQKKMYMLCILTSIIAQVLGIFFCVAVASSLKLGLTFSQIAYFSSLTIILSAMPVAINGLGIREGSYVWLFNKVGLDGELALSFSFLIVFLITFRSIAGGILYAVEKDKRVFITG